MRSALTSLTLVALFAAMAGSAAARPVDQPFVPRATPAHHAAVAPGLGAQHRIIGSDATNASAPVESPAPVVRVTAPAADGGIDWAGVGIGAGLAAALLLSAAAMSAMRRHPPMHLR
jgi:hypothetical protein